ncbi:glycosyltransferase family 2 protein [Mucilaginibacter sp. RCC_168]|uniref:glycosyltransferase family 2 protein n=1 Tax=Mucilaginibacter sp. RCC_168 TaxID=3239221 RepID=UPI003523F4CF
MSICLSICIPTKGRLEILKNTLDSIYSDYEGNYDEFEVVISDNSTDELLPQMLNAYKQHPNIVYEKTNVEGFLNSINALKMGKGLFLKLHNDYTILKKGALAEIISFVKTEAEKKPLIFFSNYERRRNDIARYDSFDSFIYDLSFLNTWSTGFAIWKEDFNVYSKMDLNEVFPHTSLFLFQHEKRSFVINDILLFNNYEVNKKGGYNLFNAFAVQYLSMVEDCLKKNQITQHTFNHIKQDLFKNFLVVWYYNTKVAINQYTFDLSGIKASIKVYYSELCYYQMIILAYKRAFLKNAKKRFFALLK